MMDDLREVTLKTDNLLSWKTGDAEQKFRHKNFTVNLYVC